MTSKMMKVGIISREAYRERTIAIARGEYTPTRSEPKIWFESLRSMSEILSNENRHLLRLIHDHKPQSLAELEEISGRKKSNLSRTLKTMEKYGLVNIAREDHKLVPKVLATGFRVEFGI